MTNVCALCHANQCWVVIITFRERVSSSFRALYLNDPPSPLLSTCHDDHVQMQLCDRVASPDPPSFPFVRTCPKSPGKWITDSSCLHKSYLTMLCPPGQGTVLKYSASPIRRLVPGDTRLLVLTIGVIEALQAPVSDEYTLVHVCTYSSRP
jgi:hypothetical protein